MPIERKHKSQPAISAPGEYLVEVTEVNAGRSKSGKPMCTVTFETPTGEQIRGYYVGELKFHMAALMDCKKAAGLAPNVPATNLVGKKLGIAVEPGKVRDDGSHFMQITGYGTLQELMGKEAVNLEMGNAPATEFAQNDEVPF